MHPKELKQKLLQQQETRQLLPAATPRKELVSKLRKWPDFSSLGGEREKMEISQETMRLHEDLQGDAK